LDDSIANFPLETRNRREDISNRTLYKVELGERHLEIIRLICDDEIHQCSQADLCHGDQIVRQ